jgi:hypothetical protein
MHTAANLMRKYPDTDLGSARRVWCNLTKVTLEGYLLGPGMTRAVTTYSRWRTGRLTGRSSRSGRLGTKVPLSSLTTRARRMSSCGRRRNSREILLQSSRNCSRYIRADNGTTGMIDSMCLAWGCISTRCRRGMTCSSGCRCSAVKR